jgi:hypothetical protein
MLSLCLWMTRVPFHDLSIILLGWNPSRVVGSSKRLPRVWCIRCFRSDELFSQSWLLFPRAVHVFSICPSVLQDIALLFLHRCIDTLLLSAHTCSQIHSFSHLVSISRHLSVIFVLCSKLTQAPLPVEMLPTLQKFSDFFGGRKGETLLCT